MRSLHTTHRRKDVKLEANRKNAQYPLAYRKRSTIQRKRCSQFCNELFVLQNHECIIPNFENIESNFCGDGQLPKTVYYDNYGSHTKLNHKRRKCQRRCFMTPSMLMRDCQKVRRFILFDDDNNNKSDHDDQQNQMKTRTTEDKTSDKRNPNDLCHEMAMQMIQKLNLVEHCSSSTPTKAPMNEKG
mmetsp:Transcript_23100/g.54598  ORF Transcript_23100/g.54598 Transcript_23100/m.54598 type:complete len:186 (-) Transcript_23100:96-653(-)